MDNELIDHYDEIEGEETLSNEAKEKLNKTETSEDNPYPYENINIGRDNFSAFQLYRKYKDNIIKLDPDFQRESNVWNPKQKSELIESILIGIPLPIFYVKQDKKGNLILIDGRQRLSTIFDYMDNKFSLSGLKILSKFNGFLFKGKDEDDEKSLKSIYRGKIEDVNLTLHIIKEPTPEKLTYDLFDRVNRGGTRLNNQEMRNAIYQGSSTLFLKTLSKLESFKNVTETISPSRMKDRYLILRFVAFYLWRKKITIDFNNRNPLDYKSDLEDFLAKTMDFLNSKEFEVKDLELKSEEILTLTVNNNEICLKDNNEIFVIKSDLIFSNIQISFEKAMKNILNLFGNNSFRLPKKEGGTLRPINMALFEVITYFFIELEDEFDEKRKIILDEYNKLINNELFKITNKEDDDFVGSLTYTVDSNKSVIKRFTIIEKKIKYIKEEC
ncbi:DUF262 domain-containing protein [Flavobacterium sp. F372]|uniref:DUF262 domain-containing protein n=1 Tax=Flavobacterium bernardetii TaxID=2813823 RepID=A0ABR7IX04_9FLAO|nr:DUF262 domain-containing protein [Flavobacterium bernardetii]MBC5834311.1 DUF262 domain-containing protein [Flavobacterium bernardetii]NHF70050.1 DUF262 domain-containing protein [Flavobacterium bernardetii]